MWRFRPDVLRAALWAALCLRRVRHQLAKGIAQPVLTAPPELPLKASLGVNAVLTRFGPTCLEGALVRQRWLAAHGIERDIVIGVPPEGLKDEPAHAWVDGTDEASAGRYMELHRMPLPRLEH